MPRLVYLSGVGAALVALAFAFTNYVIGPSPGVTEANARRIRPGMTIVQVEGVLGGPGRLVFEEGAPGIECRGYQWVAAGGQVVVVFNRRGGSSPAVSQTLFIRTASPSPLARLRAWLGW
jgi:hypothetical protein